MRHILGSWLIRCKNMKWIWQVLWNIQSISVHRWKDRQTYRWTDEQGETSIPPSTSLSVGYANYGSNRIYKSSGIMGFLSVTHLANAFQQGCRREKHLIMMLPLIIPNHTCGTKRWLNSVLPYCCFETSYTYRWYPAKRALPAMLTHGR